MPRLSIYAASGRWPRLQGLLALTAMTVVSAAPLVAAASDDLPTALAARDPAAIAEALGSDFAVPADLDLAEDRADALWAVYRRGADASPHPLLAACTADAVLAAAGLLRGGLRPDRSTALAAAWLTRPAAPAPTLAQVPAFAAAVAHPGDGRLAAVQLLVGVVDRRFLEPLAQATGHDPAVFAAGLAAMAALAPELDPQSASVWSDRLCSYVAPRFAGLADDRLQRAVLLGVELDRERGRELVQRWFADAPRVAAADPHLSMRIAAAGMTRPVMSMEDFRDLPLTRARLLKLDATWSALAPPYAPAAALARMWRSQGAAEQARAWAGRALTGLLAADARPEPAQLLAAARLAGRTGLVAQTASRPELLAAVRALIASDGWSAAAGDRDLQPLGRLLAAHRDELAMAAADAQGPALVRWAVLAGWAHVQADALEAWAQRVDTALAGAAVDDERAAWLLAQAHLAEQRLAPVYDPDLALRHAPQPAYAHHAVVRRYAPLREAVATAQSEPARLAAVHAMIAYYRDRHRPGEAIDWLRSVRGQFAAATRTELDALTCAACGASSTEKGSNLHEELPRSDAPAEPDAYNDWVTIRRECRVEQVDGAWQPVGERTTTFLSPHSKVVYRVRQTFDPDTGTQSAIRIAHTIYDSQGRIVERREPSACVGYQVAYDSDGWVIDPDAGAPSVTDAGVVREYTYFPPGEQDEDGEWIVPDFNENRKAVYTRAGIAPDAPRRLVSSSEYIRYVPDDSPYKNDDGTYLVEPDQLAKVYLASQSTYPVATTDLAHPDRQTTRYEYEFYTTADGPQHNGRLHLRTKTTIAPALSASEHGAGSEARWVAHYRWVPGGYTSDGEVLVQPQHYVDWRRAPDGGLTFVQRGTDPAAVDYRKTTLQISDVRTDAGGLTAEGYQAPLGWSDTDGRHQTTRYTYDAQGRRAETIREDGTRSRSSRIVCTASLGTTLLTVAEASVSARFEPDGSTLIGQQQFSYRSADGLWSYSGSGLPDLADGDLDNDFTAGFRDGSEGVQAGFRGVLYALSASQYSFGGQTERSLRWEDPNDQSTGAVVHTTRYFYDARGRRRYTVAPAGSATRSTYDGADRVVATAITRVTNPDTVTAATLDALGDAWKTTETTVFDTLGRTVARSSQTTVAGSPVSYTSRLRYDRYGRQVRSLGPDGRLQVSEYDALGRTVASASYVGITDIDAAPPSSALRQRSTTTYDRRGQAYTRSTTVYDDTGTAVATRTSGSWFDAVGRVIKTRGPDGLLQKTIYDSAGWRVASYTGADPAESDSDYAAAQSLDGDTIAQQSIPLYDAVGRVIATASYQRTEGATATGALT
ncbi:MAG: hypothetical protein ACLFP0_07880, partial [Rhodosalinus sp.]